MHTNGTIKSPPQAPEPFSWVPTGLKTTAYLPEVNRCPILQRIHSRHYIPQHCSLGDREPVQNGPYFLMQHPWIALQSENTAWHTWRQWCTGLERKNMKLEIWKMTPTTMVCGTELHKQVLCANSLIQTAATFTGTLWKSVSIHSFSINFLSKFAFHINPSINYLTFLYTGGHP